LRIVSQQYVANHAGVGVVWFHRSKCCGCRATVLQSVLLLVVTSRQEIALKMTNQRLR